MASTYKSRALAGHLFLLLVFIAVVGGTSHKPGSKDACICTGKVRINDNVKTFKIGDSEGKTAVRMDSTRDGKSAFDSLWTIKLTYYRPRDSFQQAAHTSNGAHGRAEHFVHDRSSAGTNEATIPYLHKDLLRAPDAVLYDSSLVAEESSPTQLNFDRSSSVYPHMALLGVPNAGQDILKYHTKHGDAHQLSVDPEFNEYAHSALLGVPNIGVDIINHIKERRTDSSTERDHTTPQYLQPSVMGIPNLGDELLHEFQNTNDDQSSSGNPKRPQGVYDKATPPINATLDDRQPIKKAANLNDLPSSFNYIPLLGVPNVGQVAMEERREKESQCAGKYVDAFIFAGIPTWGGVKGRSSLTLEITAVSENQPFEVNGTLRDPGTGELVDVSYAGVCRTSRRKNPRCTIC